MNRLNPPLFLWVASIASVAGMLWAAAHGARAGLVLASLGFAATAVLAASRLSAALLRTERPGNGHVSAIREISRITALVYAWGGVSLIALYRFTPLHWQHGWQYGSAMLLIATGLIAYIAASGRSPPGDIALSRTIQLTIAHGLAALVAMIWLAGSGKLATVKGDWAANAIFMSGGLAIACISYMAVRNHRELRRLSA